MAAIRQLTSEFVAGGGTIRQVKEQRPEYNGYAFYYKAVVIVPESAFSSRCVCLMPMLLVPRSFSSTPIRNVNEMPEDGRAKSEALSVDVSRLPRKDGVAG